MKYYEKVIGEILEEDEVQGKYIRQESHQSVIIITPNELWDLWAEAAHRQVDSETRLKNIEMFNTYLESKGIKLNSNG